MAIFDRFQCTPQGFHNSVIVNCSQEPVISSKDKPVERSIFDRQQRFYHSYREGPTNFPVKPIMNDASNNALSLPWHHELVYHNYPSLESTSSSATLDSTTKGLPSFDRGVHYRDLSSGEPQFHYPHSPLMSEFCGQPTTTTSTDMSTLSSLPIDTSATTRPIEYMQTGPTFSEAALRTPGRDGLKLSSPPCNSSEGVGTKGSTYKAHSSTTTSSDHTRPLHTPESGSPEDESDTESSVHASPARKVRGRPRLSAKRGEERVDAGRLSHLERNRRAASRHRRRKREWITNLHTKVGHLEKERDSLTGNVVTLKEQVLFLREILLNHSNCQCDKIQDYLNWEVRAISQNTDMNVSDLSSVKSNQRR